MALIGAGGLAIGETPNIAARLEKLAQPNTIVVSEATRKLVDGYFHVQSLGQQTLKGIAGTIEVHAVLGATRAETRLAATSSRLTPFVGRELEMQELAELWGRSSHEGAARIVTVSGESGVGKSRLVQTFKETVQSECAVLEGYCSPLRRNAAFRPIAQMLEAASGAAGASDATSKTIRLDTFVRHLGLEGDATSLLSSVVGLPIDDDPMAAVAPGVRRLRTMSLLVSLFHALARSRAVLLVIEDLHWADPSTLEFLTAFKGSPGASAVMILATTRPEADEVWKSDSGPRIALSRLSHELAERIVDSVAKDQRLPSAVRERILGLADGIPLYLEEVARAALEALAVTPAIGDGNRPVDRAETLIPATVRDSLAARLDRLGKGKVVAQLAAILGREFPHDVLRTVGLMEEADLRGGLRDLIDSGLLLEDERNGRRVYRFRHSLIQEVAYESLLKSRRRQYHHRVASVLLDQFPEISDAQPDVIAQHYSRADLPKLASTYFERAGTAAFTAQAYLESTNHLRSALTEIEKLPQGDDRDRRELSVLVALGLPLLMTKGYAAPDVQATYERAAQLSTEESTPVRILFGVWAAQLVLGNIRNTERMVAQFQRIAETSHHSAERFIAWAAIGSHAFWRGDFGEAIAPLRSAVGEFNPSLVQSLPRDYGYDNAFYGHVYLAWALQMSGHFEESRRLWVEAWEATVRTQSPYLLALQTTFGAAMARDLGNLDEALELSKLGIDLAAKHHLAFCGSISRILHGSALCLRGEVPDGTPLIEEGLGFCRAIGVKTPLGHYLAHLADAYLRARETEKGLAVVEEGLEIAERRVDRSSLAEHLRLKAELLRQGGGDREVAERGLRRALEVAREQRAVTWELVTAKECARSLANDGKRGQALEVLDGALTRVVSGEPPVVVEARRLRDEIAAMT